VPHVVILSIAREHLERIDRQSDSEWFELCQLPKRTGSNVLGRWYRLHDGARSLFVYAAAAQTPLGSISNSAKDAIATRIRQCLDGGDRL
jgi:hypothetical protein